ncbi:MAG: DUF3604 domain-containing protein [Burkholderiales bacterium]|nr:MAG: DUF3604 domain-containing protein [Burkholderiales bacterium]
MPDLGEAAHDLAATSQKGATAFAQPASRSRAAAGRVIEIPTLRWTACNAKRFGVNIPKEVPMTTTERAYTSPIWSTP